MTMTMISSEAIEALGKGLSLVQRDLCGDHSDHGDIEEYGTIEQIAFLIQDLEADINGHTPDDRLDTLRVSVWRSMIAASKERASK